MREEAWIVGLRHANPTYSYSILAEYITEVALSGENPDLAARSGAIFTEAVRLRDLNSNQNDRSLVHNCNLTEHAMASITLKNIPEDLHQRLREAARRHHRSLAREILTVLEAHVRPHGRSKQEILAEVQAIRDKYLPTIMQEDIDAWKNEGRP